MCYGFVYPATAGVAEGLLHIYNKGVLHNDIKADNVALSDCTPACKEHTPKFWPTIIDFGKACPVNNGKRNNTTKTNSRSAIVNWHLI